MAYRKTDGQMRNAFRLRFLRKRVLKLTQTELGRRIGYHYITILNWERGRTKIPKIVLSYIEHLAKEKKHDA